MAATPEPDTILGHWSTLVENFQTSPLEFLAAVEAAIVRRQVPDTKPTRIDYREGGALSANREYLHVVREKLVFDIAAAPFGTGFFVSWWLADDRPRLHPVARLLILFGELLVFGWLFMNIGVIAGLFFLGAALAVGLALVNPMVDSGDLDYGLVASVPILGTLYVSFFKPETYYRTDKMEMFRTAVHNAVLEALDEMTTTKGIRALSDADRKPVMRDFFKKF